MLTDTLRSRGFAASLHAGLWVVLLLALLGLRGRNIRFGEADPDPIAVQKPVPVVRLEALYQPSNQVARLTNPTNATLFATAHFIPPVKPTPPPPTTRRVEITYHGFFQAAAGPQRVLLLVGETMFPVSVGGMVVSNLWVADAAFKTLTLTNSAGQTNALAVNVKQAVEVPLK